MRIIKELTEEMSKSLKEIKEKTIEMEKMNKSLKECQRSQEKQTNQQMKEANKVRQNLQWKQKH